MSPRKYDPTRYRRTDEAEALAETQSAKCQCGAYLRFWVDEIGRLREICDTCEAAARSSRVAARVAADRARAAKMARARVRG